jgi:hypothetical protein
MRGGVYLFGTALVASILHGALRAWFSDFRIHRCIRRPLHATHIGGRRGNRVPAVSGARVSMAESRCHRPLDFCNQLDRVRIQPSHGRACDCCIVPKWMPLGGNFWTVLTGVAFVLAGIAIFFGILDVLAARLLTLMLLVFNVVALAPLPITSPRDHVAWGANAYNLAAVGAVWIFAESLASGRRERIQPAAPEMGLIWK